MIDRSLNREGPQAQVPVLSEALHLIALSVLVFLRSSFGYSYLKPVLKTLLLFWAFLLFVFYAHSEENDQVLNETRGLMLYGGAAFTLFYIHAGAAWIKELRSTGNHDLYSGRPLLPQLLFLRLSGNRERQWKLIVDPLLVVVAAAFFFFIDEIYLACWLASAGLVLFLKEFNSFWVFRRRQKPVKDNLTDIEELLGDSGMPDSPPPPSVRTTQARQAAAFRERRVEAPTPSQEEIYFASLLDLTFPLSFRKIRRAYMRKIRQVHPDKNGSSDSTQESILVNQAWEYFKALYGR